MYIFMPGWKKLRCFSDIYRTKGKICSPYKNNTEKVSFEETITFPSVYLYLNTYFSPGVALDFKC